MYTVANARTTINVDGAFVDVCMAISFNGYD
jgi:hypothetical protein